MKYEPLDLKKELFCQCWKWLRGECAGVPIESVSPTGPFSNNILMDKHLEATYLNLLGSSLK